MESTAPSKMKQPNSHHLEPLPEDFPEGWIRAHLQPVEVVCPEGELPPGMRFKNILSDSRKIERGDLFIALSGDSVDGHDYVASAFERGAKGAIIQTHKKDQVTCPSGCALYLVPDTLVAYRQLGMARRLQFQGPVIGVAGSVGKTTTKELISAAISGKFEFVHKTLGSQNGYVGIPMTLLELQPRTQAAVIEIGIDEIGAMATHTETVQPTLSVMTRIAEEHLFQLRDLPTVSHEETHLLRDTHRRGNWILGNWDDPWVRPDLERLGPDRQVGISMDRGFPFPSGMLGLWGQWIDSVASGGIEQLKIETTRGQKMQFALPLPGQHNALNLLTSVAAALALGLNPEEIQEGLKRFQTAFGRTEIHSGPQNSHWICDYYNASPASVRAAIQLLVQKASASTTAKEPSGHVQKILVLGDMLELGEQEEKLHRDLAGPILAAQIDHVLLFGQRTQWIADALQKGAIKKTDRDPFQMKVSHFKDHESLAKEIQSILSIGNPAKTWGLIKGSRSMKMETVWKLLQPK